jgi:glycosyltransferase involved in cell wall biosynthesis
MAQITVILPVLNGMPYLSEALASLEAQTFRDFEVVLWDNGSTDGTVEEARRWIPSRLPGCLARMVNEAGSPLIARMDADDVCLPHRFEEQVGFLERNPAISLVGCQVECIDPQGKRLPKEHWAQFPLEHHDIVTQLLFNNPICHPCILFRTESVRECGNYAMSSPVEDLELYLRLVQTKRVANLASVGVYYRRHPTSICAVAGKEDRLAGQMMATQALYAEALFGIDSETYSRLRDKSYPLAIFPLLKSAVYRSHGNLASFLGVVRTPTFLFIGRCLMGKRDFVSKLFFRIVDVFTPADSPRH